MAQHAEVGSFNCHRKRSDGTFGLRRACDKIWKQAAVEGSLGTKLASGQALCLIYSQPRRRPFILWRDRHGDSAFGGAGRGKGSLGACAQDVARLATSTIAEAPASSRKTDLIVVVPSNAGGVRIRI